MRNKSLLLFTACVLLAVGTIGYLALRPERLQIPAPVATRGEPPDVAATLSQLQIEFILELAALQQALNEKSPKSFDGSIENPIDFLQGDTLDWHLDLAEIALAPGDGAITFQVPFTGQATRRGAARVEQGNQGLRGLIEGLLSKSLPETAEFAGVINGSIQPTFNPDWSIDPHLTATVDLTKAEAALFSGLPNISFHSLVQRTVQEKAAEFAAGLNQSLAANPALRTAAQRGWTALHVVTPVYTSPPVWVSLTPVTVGASAPVITQEHLILNVSASLRAGVRVSEAKPAPLPVPLPELSPVFGTGGALSLSVPVALDLASFHAISPAQLQRPDTFQTRAGQVRVKRVFLLGDDGVLWLGADVEAKPNWWRTVTGTVYLAGTPVLDKETGVLRMQDLRYDVRTSNVLVKAANLLLQPTLLAELQKLAVFDINSSKTDLLGLANARIAKLEARLPSDIALDFQVKEIAITDLIVDNGWLVAVAKASGPATVRVSGLGGVLGEAKILQLPARQPLVAPASPSR